MAKALNWGIIGTGRIANKFAAALNVSADAKLTAVGSRKHATTEDFGQKFGVPCRHGSYEELIDNPEVEAVYIAIPHPFHAQWSLRCAAAGKHQICEKPLAMNHAEAMAMVEAAHRNNVYLSEGFAYRCTPMTTRLVQLIRDGAIGEVKRIISSYSFKLGPKPARRLVEPELGGGAILDVGCYPISMVRLLAGVAMGQKFADPVDLEGMARMGPTGVDFHATAILRFDGGIIAQVSTGLDANDGIQLEIFGDEGSLSINTPWHAQGSILLRRTGEEPEEIVIERGKTLFAYEIEEASRHLKHGQTPAMSWADSLGNMRTLDRWRNAVNFSYPCEKPNSGTWPIYRESLKPSSGHNMNYNHITGVRKKISRLVMGTDYCPGDAHAAVMFDDFFERGGNCFDTAEQYFNGEREKVLGRWMKNRNLREEIVILDKGGHTPHCWPEIIQANIPRSLERLQTDYIDIYMLHRDNPEVPVGEFIEVLNEQINAGHIHVLGASNWTKERVDQANAYAAQKGLIGFAAVSNNFSLARMVKPMWEGCLASSESDYRLWHLDKQMPLMSWSSQARGFFTDRSGPRKKQDRLMVKAWYSKDNFERKRRAVALAKEKGVLPINIALAYVLDQLFPTFALICPYTLEEMRTTMDGLDISLTKKEIQWLNLELEELQENV